MARMKRESDKIYNIRRRAKRALARAERKGDMRLADDLRQEIAKTYMDRGTKRYREGIEQVKRNLQGLIGQEGAASARKKVQRSNVAFLRELNNAAKGLPSSVTERIGYSATLEVKTFFAATRDMWEYVPGGNTRPVETVAGILGFDSLREAYSYIMSRQSEALSRIDQMEGFAPVDNIMQPTEMTFDERYRYVLSYINVMR